MVMLGSTKKYIPNRFSIDYMSSQEESMIKSVQELFKILKSNEIVINSIMNDLVQSKDDELFTFLVVYLCKQHVGRNFKFRLFLYDVKERIDMKDTYHGLFAGIISEYNISLTKYNECDSDELFLSKINNFARAYDVSLSL